MKPRSGLSVLFKPRYSSLLGQEFRESRVAAHKGLQTVPATKGRCVVS